MPAFDEEEEDRTFVQRHKALCIAAVLLIAGVGAFVSTRLAPHQSLVTPAEVRPITWIPVPTPAPKSTPEPTPIAKATPETTPVGKLIVDTIPKTVIPVRTPTGAPGPIHTGIGGPSGNPDLGLGPGNDGPGGPGNGDGPYGSKYGSYLSQVQQRVADALRSNPHTRKSSMNVIVRIWPDATGRITRTTISGAAIDAALRNALQNGVLAGLQLSEPPPADMPLPIVMRLSVQRP